MSSHSPLSSAERKNLELESNFQPLFGFLVFLYFPSHSSPNSTRSDTYKLVTWWWPIFLSFLWASDTHRLASTCVFFFSPTDVWVPLMVIYCRAEQPGLNCTLKLLTILMPPNHPKMYFFSTEGCGAVPIFLSSMVECGVKREHEETILQLGFRDALVPSF